MSIEMLEAQRIRHTEAPRSYQRGEGSRASRNRATVMRHPLKTAALRDDAILRIG
jgi:hypothetical protein